MKWKKKKTQKSAWVLRQLCTCTQTIFSHELCMFFKWYLAGIFPSLLQSNIRSISSLPESSMVTECKIEKNTKSLPHTHTYKRRTVITQKIKSDT